jgi:hypothetical protein
MSYDPKDDPWIVVPYPVRPGDGGFLLERHGNFMRRFMDDGCAWPVEARFLAACVDDNPMTHEWSGPYPLHDLASVLMAAGRDPLAKNERLPGELPEHDPLADARQSARLLLAALAPATTAA